MPYKNSNVKYLALSSMFLALALVLSVITGQLQQIGNALCPMHIPVILCGFFCGPMYGLLTGILAPILRFFIFGVPPLMPRGICMSIELGTYGLVSALMYRALPRTKLNTYISLLTAMVLGRITWGVSRVICTGLGPYEFGWQAFMAGAFLNAIPGIIIQIIIIPVIVIALKKQTISER